MQISIPSEIRQFFQHRDAHRHVQHDAIIHVETKHKDFGDGGDCFFVDLAVLESISLDRNPPIFSLRTWKNIEIFSVGSNHKSEIHKSKIGTEILKILKVMGLSPTVSAHVLPAICEYW